MTFGQMRDYVIANLGLEDISSLDEGAMVDMWLNQGVLDLLSRTRCVARCVQLTTQANVSNYTLDHNILCLIDSDNDLPQGRRFRSARREEAGDPSFTLIRSDLLIVKPTPSEDGMQVQVWAVLKPQPMATDADDPGTEAFGAIPPEYQDAIITYALWKCADYADDQSSQSGERFRALYEGPDGRGGRLGQIKTMVNKRGTSIPIRRQVRMTGVSSSGAYVG